MASLKLVDICCYRGFLPIITLSKYNRRNIYKVTPDRDSTPIFNCFFHLQYFYYFFNTVKIREKYGYNLSSFALSF